MSVGLGTGVVFFLFWRFLAVRRIAVTVKPSPVAKWLAVAGIAVIVLAGLVAVIALFAYFSLKPRSPERAALLISWAFFLFLCGVASFIWSEQYRHGGLRNARMAWRSELRQLRRGPHKGPT